MVFLPLLFIFLSIGFDANSYNKTPNRQHWTSGKYSITKTSSDLDSSITISRKGREIFQSTDLSDKSSLLNEHTNPIGDINNNGKPDVVIFDYSGGAHCCHSAMILELSTTAKEILELGESSCGFEFKNIDRQPGLEIVTCDEYGAWTSFATAAFPQIILRYKNGAYVLAENLMKKPPLSKAKIAAAVSKINEGNYKNFQYLKNFSATSTQLTSENYFSQLLPQALALIYCGNYHQAKIIIDKTWPGTENEKKEFLDDLLKEVMKRRNGAEILRMNHLQ